MIDYQSVDDTSATPDEKETIAGVQDASKKTVLRTATILPITMFVAYLLLMAYFNSQGGYKPIELMSGDAAQAAPDSANAEMEPAPNENDPPTDGENA